MSKFKDLKNIVNYLVKREEELWTNLNKLLTDFNSLSKEFKNHQDINNKNNELYSEFFNLIIKQLNCSLEKEDYIGTKYNIEIHKQEKVVRQRYILKPIKKSK